MQDNFKVRQSNYKISIDCISHWPLNVVAYHLRFYYAIDESVKDSRDVVFIIFAGQHKIIGSWSKEMTTLS